MLELTKEEQAWLDAYQEALNKEHPGTVQEILIYGSKARGQARLDSDLDVLLIVKDKAVTKKRPATHRLPAGRDHGRFALYSRLHPGRVGKPEAKRLQFP
jgi:predicted nucleotidyltransferase